MRKTSAWRGKRGRFFVSCVLAAMVITGRIHSEPAPSSTSPATEARDESDTSDVPPTPSSTDDAPFDPTRATPTLRAVRVERGPRIDGRLNEDLWQQAPVAGPIYQYRPKLGELMSQRTEFRVVYDEDHLYIGVWCYDTEPDKIIARVMSRDGQLSADDWIVIVIDPYFDQRNGYYFQVNPTGARRDQLISDNVNANENWDGIWMAAATIDDEGWKVEVAIPFKTISFNPDTETWGLNFARRIKRNNETGRWSHPLPEISTYNVAEAGTLTGLRGLRQGVGLDVKPYALVDWESDRDDRDDTVDPEAGMDVRYRLTPNLAALLSINTDFAETEVDTRQVNLTRFPLFFPEKREFFLEDAGIFQFGGLEGSAGSSSSSSSGDVKTRLIPFFSRRIGLDEDGEIVPIIAAGKLTGRIDGYNVGVVNALLEDNNDLGNKNVFVGRVKHNVLEQSSLGLLTTYGDPNAEEENLLVGSDFGYRTTSLFGDQILEANAYGLSTHTEGAEDDVEPAYGVNVSMPNDLYRVKAGYKEIASGFDPAVGFVSREGVRAYDSTLMYRPRIESSDLIYRAIFKYNNEYVTSLSNSVETVAHELRPFYLWFESNDEVWVEIDYDRDSPEEDFEIRDGVIIEPDDYDWYSYNFVFDSSSSRILRTTLQYKFGDFYDGTRERYVAKLILLPWRYFGVQTSYILNRVRLPEGDFDARLASVQMDWNFTPDLTWFHFLQFDNETDSIGYNSRIQWEFQPGQMLFIVLNQDLDRNSGDLRLRETRLTTKIGLTVRF